MAFSRALLSALREQAGCERLRSPFTNARPESILTGGRVCDMWGMSLHHGFLSSWPGLRLAHLFSPLLQRCSGKGNDGAAVAGSAITSCCDQHHIIRFLRIVAFFETTQGASSWLLKLEEHSRASRVLKTSSRCWQK